MALSRLFIKESCKYIVKQNTQNIVLIFCKQNQIVIH